MYGYNLHSIGISKDYLPIDALEHLSKYGYFDEILIGNNWSNIGIIKYSLQISRVVTVPQIVVTKRTFNTIETGNKTSYVGISEEKLITRKVGSSEIVRWAQNGSPLANDKLSPE